MSTRRDTRSERRGARIVERHALGQFPGINAEENNLTNERIGPEFEREPSKLALVVDHGLDFLAVAIMALHRRNVDGARQIIHHAIEEALHALLLERRAGDDPGEL